MEGIPRLGSASRALLPGIGHYLQNGACCGAVMGGTHPVAPRHSATWTLMILAHLGKFERR